MKKTLGAEWTKCLEVAHRLEIHKEYPHLLTEDDLINVNLVPIYALLQWLLPKIEEDLGMLLEENESIEDLFQSYFEYESFRTMRGSPASCDDVFNFINNLPPPTRSAFKSNTNPQTAAFAKPSHTTFIIFLLICLGKRPSLGSNLGF
ncbi:hypothetical protein L3Y34_013566 [Caenorhabditis briggsae]|uniref:CCDC93 N-terminal domain-containing protein n=1 Tax=Caenorhabditis briggsae TaxID=6238 RepID=A0AAE8ZV93_CAEBR|nr:hypothetical protein L3Y34_013566 [Caenorhabditis briggsae]